MESGRSNPDQIYTYDSDLDPKFIPPQPKKIKKETRPRSSTGE